MAKAPAPQSKAPKGTVTVIYRPINFDDRPVVKWNGLTFHANVPVELDPALEAHHIVQLLPKTYPGANGEVLTKHSEAKVFMGELAKANPSFEVDGVRAKRKINTRVVPPPGAEWTEAHEGQISTSDEIDQSVAA